MIWAIIAVLVAVPLASLGVASFDLEWRAFLKDTQTIFAGAVVLAAALITYRGATSKIVADREDAIAARKRRRAAFREALASELIATGWELGRTKANATQFAGLPSDMPRREIAHLRLRAPKLGFVEWQDLAALGKDPAARYYQIAARIEQLNLFIEAVQHDAVALRANPSVEEEVQHIARPFASLAEHSGYIAADAEKLAEEIRQLPDT